MIVSKRATATFSFVLAAALASTGCGGEETQERTIIREDSDEVEIRADDDGFELDVKVGEDGDVSGEVNVREGE